MQGTNAAQELLELIDSWEKGPAIAAARSGDAGWEGVWQAQIRAVRLLAEVETFLRVREDAAEYEPLINELRKFVFAADAQWSSHAVTLDDRDRLQLKLMSELMKTTPLRVVLGPGEVDALRSAVEECLNVLDLDPPQIEEGANYLRYLLHRCLDLLKGEHVDLVALRHLSFEATGVAVQVARGLPEDRRDAFAEAAGRLSHPWFGNVSAGAVGNLLADGFNAVAGAIGGG